MKVPKVDGEGLIGATLRWSVIASTMTIALGVLLSPMKIGAYQGCPATLAQVCGANVGRADPSMANVFAALANLNPLALIEVGVLVLLVTPFLRVAAGGLMFAHRKDWNYVAISAVVLGVLLLASFVVGPAEAG